MLEVLNRPVNEYTGLSLDCSCGRRHEVPIESILLGSGTAKRILELTQPFWGKPLLLVSDVHTYEALGKTLEALLSPVSPIKSLVYQETHLHPDEAALGRLFLELEDASCIVTAGSGTLNDITRFVSAKTGIPYYIAGTAPSMDGYASVTSALLRNGVKISSSLVYPKGIVGDTAIMKEAPMHMLHAGLGDMIGKYTALSDWRSAHILNGEYYCSEVASVVSCAVEKCVQGASGLPKREESSVLSVLEGLVLSGIAIGMVGISRPAAGEEHNLAHCWEMLFLSQNRDTHWLHGNLVGAATGILLDLNHALAAVDIEHVLSSGKPLQFDRTRWEQTMHRVYGRNADHLISGKLPYLPLTTEARDAEAKKTVSNWDDLCSQSFDAVPDPAKVKQMMRDIGAAYHPADLGIDKDTFRDTLRVAKDMRIRFGILQILENLGLLEEHIDRLTDLYY